MASTARMSRKSRCSRGSASPPLCPSPATPPQVHFTQLHHTGWRQAAGGANLTSQGGFISVWLLCYKVKDKARREPPLTLITQCPMLDTPTVFCFSFLNCHTPVFPSFPNTLPSHQLSQYTQTNGFSCNHCSWPSLGFIAPP